MYTVARFAIDVAKGRSPLPLLTETLLLAEQARRSLMSTCKYISRRGSPSLADADIWPLSPAFWGKVEHGQPRTGHGHAFFLPADEDGDGRLDHLTVHAPMGLNSLERLAIDRLRSVPFGDGDPLRLLLIGLGNGRDFRTPLLAESNVWVSTTPFVVTRHMKRRGLKRDPREFFEAQDGRAQFVKRVLREELQRRGFPYVEVEIESLDQVGSHTSVRSLQFRLARRKPGDDGASRPRGVFRLRFRHAVAGPIALGHSCHFGLGLFLPE